jgi:site-specific recombinase XerC
MAHPSELSSPQPETQFRHLHSSLLNHLRVPVKIAQEQLGHVSVSTTLNIYTHVIDASHRKAVEAIEERLFGEMEEQIRSNVSAHDGASTGPRSAARRTRTPDDVG